MLNKSWIGIILLCLIYQADVLAQKKHKSKSTEEEPYVYKISKKDLQIQNLYIEAVNEKVMGNLKDAVGLFNAVIKLDPNNHAAYYELSRLAYQNNDLEAAEKLAAKAVKLNPKNEFYHIYYAEAKAQMNDYIGAAEAYQTIVDELPDLNEYLQDVAYMYGKAGEYQKAIDTYNKIEKIEGISEALSIQKKSMYIQMYKIDKAAQEIKNLIAAFPDMDNYYLLVGEIYEANEMLKKAQDSYELLLEKKPNQPQALMAVAEIQKKQGNTKDYKNTILRVFGSNELDINTKIFMFIPYIEEVAENPSKASEVLEMAELIIATHPNDAKAQTAYADVLLNVDKKEEAIVAYKKAAAYDESPITVWLQLFDLLAQESDFKTLQEWSIKGVDKFPNDATPLFYSGASSMQLKDYEKAITYYEAALLKDIENPQAIAQILAALGDANNELGNFSKSDSFYNEVLIINPNDPYTLNNYAYYLSLRGDQLEKAKKMSRRSIMLMENNASFLDTYAWILYKKKEYKEAKEWIEKALAVTNSEGNDNSVMLEHYGDILYKLGDKKEAINYWQQALKAGGEGEFLKQKIDKQTLIE